MGPQALIAKLHNGQSLFVIHVIRFLDYLMSTIFASPDLLSLESISTGLWPCDEDDRPLRFHPSVIYAKLPPDACMLTSKSSLLRAFVEFTRGLHLLWIYEEAEIDDSIKKLCQYLRLIVDGYGEDEMRFAIQLACLGAKSVERLVDVAANDLGDWRA